MSSAIPILTYLYLLTQLIYLRSKSPHKGLFLFQQGMKHDQWLCLRYQNPDDGSKFHDREVQKNTQGQWKYKISVSKRIHIFSCTTVIAKHLTKTFMLTCCWWTLICPCLSIMLTIRSVILKSPLHWQQYYS